MKSTNGNDFWLGSKPCWTCEDLRRLKARIEAAVRDARNPYSVARKAIGSSAQQNLEEGLKQTSVARNWIFCPIEAHPANQHSQAGGVRLAA
jgi:hypothetical protein